MWNLFPTFAGFVATVSYENCNFDGFSIFPGLQAFIIFNLTRFRKNNSCRQACYEHVCFEAGQVAVATSRNLWHGLPEHEVDGQLLAATIAQVYMNQSSQNATDHMQV